MRASPQACRQTSRRRGPSRAPKRRPAPPHQPTQDHEHRASVAGKARFASERADRDVILKRAVTEPRASVSSRRCTEKSRPRPCVALTWRWCLSQSRASSARRRRACWSRSSTWWMAPRSSRPSTSPRAPESTPASPRWWCCCFPASIAPQHELSKANEVNARQRKIADGPDEVAVVVVDTADWSCRLPPNCSPVVHKLTDQICS